jgi:hypothetical protein
MPRHTEVIMARSLSTFSSSVLIAFALVASHSAIGCLGDVSEGGDELTSDDLPCDEGATKSCVINASTNEEGFQSCFKDESETLVWSECFSNSNSSGSTPLVLSFDSAPVTFAASSASFDLTGSMSVATDWPTAKTPWLALDRNGNGAIDDGAELFGSASVLNNGARAENGFIALAELDGNGDGKITDADAAFSSLLVWSDNDGDRLSSSGELAPLSTFKLVSIDLAYSNVPRCDGRGNCEIERAGFRYLDAAGAEHSGSVVDVHLQFQK